MGIYHDYEVLNNYMVEAKLSKVATDVYMLDVDLVMVNYTHD